MRYHNADDIFKVGSVGLMTALLTAVGASQPDDVQILPTPAPALQYYVDVNDVTGNAGSVSSGSVEGLPPLPVRMEVLPSGEDEWHVVERTVKSGLSFGVGEAYDVDQQFLIRYSNPLFESPGQAIWLDTNYARRFLTVPVDGETFGMEMRTRTLPDGTTHLTAKPYVALSRDTVGFVAVYYFFRDRLTGLLTNTYGTEVQFEYVSESQVSGFAFCWSGDGDCNDHPFTKTVEWSPELAETLTLSSDFACTLTLPLTLESGLAYTMFPVLTHKGDDQELLDFIGFPAYEEFDVGIRQALTSDLLLGRSFQIGRGPDSVSDSDNILDAADLILELGR